MTSECLHPQAPYKQGSNYQTEELFDDLVVIEGLFGRITTDE